MKKSMLIFQRDIKRLLHNKVVMIVIAGVCVLPSLYAWFNIAANMDPYSNTKGIKVAVSNNDSGSAFQELNLNAGNSIVENLKENSQLGWTFVDESHAVDGVRSGKYYAAIVIPENFSSSLLSIVSGSPQTASLAYYTNEKKNAIAPKITGTGADAIQQEIDDTFSSVAAKAVSTLIQSSAVTLSKDINSMNTDVVSLLSETEGNLGQYQDVLQSFRTIVDDSSGSVSNALASLDSLRSSADSGSDAFSSVNALLNQGRASIGNFSSAFSQNLSDGESLLNNMYGSASDTLSKLDSQAQTVNGVIGNGISFLQELADDNGKLLEELQQLSDKLPTDLAKPVKEAIASLQEKNTEYQSLLQQLDKGNASIDDALKTADDTRIQLEALVSQSRQSLQKYRNTFDQTLLPKLNSSLDAAASINGGLSGALTGAAASADHLKSALNQFWICLTKGADALEQTGDAVNALREKAAGISADLQALQSSDTYHQFLSLEGLDADSISDFMASPVNLTSKTLYPVKNYGSSMAPFYTNLALWVGGIVLIALLKLEVDQDETVKNFSATSAYFGRCSLLLVLGVIQGLIVCLGDLLLLKVQCVHPVSFVLAGVFCSFVYVNLIYALSITLKHIGKALCVILVILQIPGSAGTYPIEMMPAFFQRLHPLLPFTYGINAMREAVAGMYHYNYARNLLCLAAYLPVAFLIGLGLRLLMMNLNYLFDQRLAETDLMLCETHGSRKERPQISLILKALLENKALRQELTEKAASFENKYQRRIRTGFIVMLVLPAVFLILMFSLESRIVFLVLWIVSIILISIYLIALEYIHERLKRQLELKDLDQDALLQTMKGEDRQ